MINASIITIGDELLIGQVVDTNSAWMAQQLLKTGINLRRRIAVGDERNAIVQALDEEKRNSDIILITGGLGPTSDDITKDVLCEYFNAALIEHAPTRQFITHLFEVVLKKPMIERNLQQAMVPDNCQVISNTRGTAPGMWFNEAGVIYISLPGVPHEMKGMMEDFVLPHLSKHFTLPFITHKTLLTIGAGESFLADMIADFEKDLPKHISLAYLPNFGQVRLRLTASGEDKMMLEQEMQTHFDILQLLVQAFLVSSKDESMEDVVGNLLTKNKKTVGTAESCTGGYIAHLLTSRDGASRFYEGSFITYAYQVKENLLQVRAEDLQKYGAVSEEVVKQMAAGALQHLQTNYVIAVSGIMGPQGGMPGKPVGTVWICVANKNGMETQLLHLRNDRIRNIQVTAVQALNKLRLFILKGAANAS